MQNKHLEIDEQRACAALRSDFLKLLFNLQDKECNAVTKENIKVACRIKAFEPTMQKIIVEDLQTPTYRFPAAILQIDDLNRLEIDYI